MLAMTTTLGRNKREMRLLDGKLDVAVWDLDVYGGTEICRLSISFFLRATSAFMSIGLAGR